MKHEEKTLFLFSQTINLLANSNKTSANEAIAAAAARVAPNVHIERNFDSIYAILEKKLDDKLEGR